jgi:hypothetical protein
MNMKTRLFSFTIILMLIASFAVAQSTNDAKTSFAVLGGVNFQNFNGKDNNGDKLENDMLLCYHAGVNIQLPLAPQIYFQPGLMYAVKGAKNSYGSLLGTFKLSYIELPLNVVYKAALGNGYFNLGFGPYIAYGIGGKATIESSTASIKKDVIFKNVVETGDDLSTPYFKALDAGGNIFIGFEMAAGIFLQLDAQLGMLKINPEDKRIVGIFTSNSVVKNTGFGISLGYRF